MPSVYIVIRYIPDRLDLLGLDSTLSSRLLFGYFEIFKWTMGNAHKSSVWFVIVLLRLFIKVS